MVLLRDRYKTRTRDYAIMTAAGTVGLLFLPWLNVGAIAAAGLMTAWSAAKDVQKGIPENTTDESGY
jgi:hypothetical protein